MYQNIFRFCFYVLFLCVDLIIIIKLIIANIHLKNRNKCIERELEAQFDYYTALLKSNKELRSFKHDFKNFRIGILKALSDGEKEIVFKMIEKAQSEFNEATERILKFNTGNGILDAILTEKQKRGSISNTIINFEGMIPQNVLSPTDLCIIFGNILDNAIEACEKISSYNQKNVLVCVNCCSGFMFISVSNPVAEKVIIHKKHIETTKKNRFEHGFGLRSISRIVKKYNGEMNISSENDKFTIKIDLCL